jgi:hypothetical protein
LLELQVRPQALGPVPCYKPRNLTPRIVEITEETYVGRTRLDTSRYPAVTDRIDAERTFDGDSPDLIHKPHAKGARFNTFFAAFTLFRVNRYDSLRSKVRRVEFTNGYAYRILTLIALHRNEFFAGEWAPPVFSFNDFVERHVKGEAVLVLAGHPAGVAANTPRCIDD